MSGDGSAATIKSSFNLIGNSTGGTAYPGFYPDARATDVDLNISYQLVGNSWLISNQTWVFADFYISCVTMSAPPC